MCIVIAALMLILFFYFSGDIINYQLVEKVDSTSFVVAQSWDILMPFWPMLAFAFLAGVLFLLLLMKLIKVKDKHK